MRHTIHTIIAIVTFCLLPISFVAAEPAAPSTNTEDSSTSSASEAGKININTASAIELQTLKGVGKKRAEQIVKDREANGPFSSAQDLTRIKGIGPKTVEKNLAIITVGVKQNKPADGSGDEGK